MQLKIKHQFQYYYAIPIIALLLALIGLVFIYSASSYSARLTYSDEFFYVKKQAISLVVGAIFMFVAMKINTEIFIKLKWVIFAVSVVLLALVFIPGLGMESYGATRWLNLGIFTMQPSEFSKFGLMIFLAAYMAENPPVNFKKMIIPILAGGIICGLIMAEPNMSITVVVGLSLIIMLFVGGLNRKWLIVMLIAVAIGGVTLILIEPYRMERLLAFVDPWKNPKDEGYQLIQSYYALANGGLFGVGLFNSRQKYLFLPFAESDFIFAVVGEEIGLFGCVALMSVFLVFILLGLKVAKKADSRYHCLLVTGLVAIIAVQSVINFAVVTGTVPPTGVPLPFVSAGGTSLVAFMFVTGLIVNVARNHSK